nr:hypothetical protein HK105_003678 [Polyrhizophydium stewartii]
MGAHGNHLGLGSYHHAVDVDSVLSLSVRAPMLESVFSLAASAAPSAAGSKRPSLFMARSTSSANGKLFASAVESVKYNAVGVAELSQDGAVRGEPAGQALDKLRLASSPQLCQSVPVLDKLPSLDVDEVLQIGIDDAMHAAAITQVQVEMRDVDDVLKLSTDVLNASAASARESASGSASLFAWDTEADALADATVATTATSATTTSAGRTLFAHRSQSESSLAGQSLALAGNGSPMLRKAGRAAEASHGRPATLPRMSVGSAAPPPAAPQQQTNRSGQPSRNRPPSTPAVSMSTSAMAAPPTQDPPTDGKGKWRRHSFIASFGGRGRKQAGGPSGSGRPGSAAGGPAGVADVRISEERLEDDAPGCSSGGAGGHADKGMVPRAPGMQGSSRVSRSHNALGPLAPSAGVGSSTAGGASGRRASQASVSSTLGGGSTAGAFTTRMPPAVHTTDRGRRVSASHAPPTRSPSGSPTIPGSTSGSPSASPGLSASQRVPVNEAAPSDIGDLLAVGETRQPEIELVGFFRAQEDPNHVMSDVDRVIGLAGGVIKNSMLDLSAQANGGLYAQLSVPEPASVSPARQRFSFRRPSLNFSF